MATRLYKDGKAEWFETSSVASALKSGYTVEKEAKPAAKTEVKKSSK